MALGAPVEVSPHAVRKNGVSVATQIAGRALNLLEMRLFIYDPHWYSPASYTGFSPLNPRGRFILSSNRVLLKMRKSPRS